MFKFKIKTLFAQKIKRGALQLVRKSLSGRLRTVVAILIPIFAAIAAPTSGAEFRDPLEIPAARVGNLTTRPMIGIAKAGTRLVAVGARGLIIFSENEGQTWTQASVPVQSDLVAVSFPNGSDGWAVGHDGVVLHTSDGGSTWDKQLDGRQAYRLFTQYFSDKKAQGGQYDKELQAVESNFGRGPFLPYLDVWFKDKLNGYAVGSFGLLIATRDGGKTWEPWFDRIDNAEMLNLNGISGVNGNVFIAAEHGAVFRLNERSGRFIKFDTGYSGSLFGVVGSAKVLVAYGLRGSIYASNDAGGNWRAVGTPSEITINSGAFDESTGEFLLVNVAGDIVVGDAAAGTFSLRKGWSGARLSGITKTSSNHYVITSPSGVQVQSGR